MHCWHHFNLEIWFASMQMRRPALGVAAVYAACSAAIALETSPSDRGPLQLCPEPPSVPDAALERSGGGGERGDTDSDADREWFQWFVHPSMTSLDVDEAMVWTPCPSLDVSVASLDQLRVEARWNISLPVDQARSKDVLWELVAVQDGEEAGSVASGGESVQPVAVEVVDDDTHDEERGTSEDEPNAATPNNGEGLECEFDAAFCVPELVAIRLPDMKQQDETDVEVPPSPLSANHSIVLEFSQPTNRPNMASTKDITQVVDISEYVGDNLTGEWSADGRVLTLKVLEIDESRVKPARDLLAGLGGTKAIIKRRQRGSSRPQKPNASHFLVSCSLPLTFRVERAGMYFVRVTGSFEDSAAQATPGTRSFRSPAFTVRPSGASHVVLVDPSDTKATRHAHHNELIRPDKVTDDFGSYQKDPSSTQPSLFVSGILSHGGDEGFVVPESAVQPLESSRSGSWSLSFWLFLTEDSTGSFRTLFFHGDGALEQRTPSAWWKPDERRLVLRVSTTNDPDVGLDSGRTLPLREWVHLGFSFHNCSDELRDEVDSSCPPPGSDTGSWDYAVEMFVNGELDQRVRVHDQVVRNFGPLHVGKGPWTSGMKGFTSDLRVFPSPLPQEQHRQRFLLEKSHYPSYHRLHKEDNELRALNKAAKSPTSQIAFLFQQLVTTPDAVNSDEEANEVRQLASQCDEQAWDRLTELAEQGNARALGHVGASLLYGMRASVNDVVSSCAPVTQNVTKAAGLLLDAVRRGDLSAARYLALALEIVGAGRGEIDTLDRLTSALLPFKLGLYHVAASAGSKEAFALLGNAYRAGGDTEAAVAAHHYFHAARDASVAYHERGKQPLHEMDRLYDFVDSEGREDLSARGQRGEDDELIQYQQVRADLHGDVEAMAAMGDLYYWGARGIPRDHERAFHYFERAAQAGNADAQCAVANMLLRGEGGVEQDNTTAIAWYERAAEAQNHPRALNGLGFIHFHGSAGMNENKTRALELFERAANEQRDGDSLFNAGYCHANGIGTADGRTNMTRAIELFETAAHTFGHFDSVMQLAEIWMRGVATREETVDGVDADWTRALPYVKAAADTGRWGGKMRAGFSLFLARDWRRAVVQYHDAEAFGGYPLATSNLAFLYDAHLVHDVKDDGVKQLIEQRALEYLIRAHERNGDREVLVRIGDFHFQGLAGLPIDPREALAWYSRASARGDDRGAYNVGFMYESGVGGVDANLLRARRYYERAAELADDSNRGHFASIPARLALLRVAAREWVHESSVLEAIASRLGSSRKVSGFGTAAVGSQDGRQYSVAELASLLGSTAVVGAVLAVLARRRLQFLRPN